MRLILEVLRYLSWIFLENKMYWSIWKWKLCLLMIWHSPVKITHRYWLYTKPIQTIFKQQHTFENIFYTLEVILFMPQCANLQFPFLKWKTGIFLLPLSWITPSKHLGQWQEMSSLVWVKTCHDTIRKCTPIFPWLVLALTLPWNCSTNISGQALITSCSRLETSL